MNSKRASIFISYSRKSSDLANKLAQALTRRGFEVWYDAMIRAGEDVSTEIQNALERANVFIVLVSPDSSSSEWWNAELGFAAGRAMKNSDVKILPVLVGNAHFDALPRRLAYWQALDANRMGIEEIAEEVSRILP